MEAPMKISFRKILVPLVMAIVPISAVSQDDPIIMAADAMHYNGKYAQVCGLIAETNYARGSRGGPTYLNFTRPYPKHNFSVIIFKRDRKNFDYKPESLEGYQACAYGLIDIPRNRPQMIISIPDQISARKVDAAPAEQSEEKTEAVEDEK
jgi:hypothetical protein